MFNFLIDTTVVSVEASSFDLNVSTPNWTVFIDSKNWVLVVAD